MARSFKLVKLCVIAALVLSNQPARAGVFAKPVISYMMNRADDGPSGGSETSRQLLDVSFGYAFDFGLMLLAHYGTEQQNTTLRQEVYYPWPPYNRIIEETSVKESRSSTGIGFGYKYGKPGNVTVYTTGVYIPNNENSVGGVVYKGSGHQVDLGVAIPAKRMNVAFQVTYRSYTYTTTDQGSGLAHPQHRSYLDPGIGLFVEF